MSEILTLSKYGRLDGLYLKSISPWERARLLDLLKDMFEKEAKEREKQASNLRAKQRSNTR